MAVTVGKIALNRTFMVLRSAVWFELIQLYRLRKNRGWRVAGGGKSENRK